MSPIAQVALVIPFAYLLGSIPFGLIIGLAKGKDARTFGSGNIGATNVARMLGGKKWFFLIFALDALKGMIPMLVGSAVLHDEVKTPAVYVLWLLVGLGAILGHMFSLFLKFKGGKGVATSAGVMLGLWPYYTLPGILALGTFAVAFFVSRYVSLASIMAAASAPLLYVVLGRFLFDWPVFGQQWPLLAFIVSIASLVIYRHRTNIARLRDGTEHRFVKKQAA
jgi:glycerol-3-phosphate acyltransferase PlsY